jgi:hypothetical protein
MESFGKMNKSELNKLIESLETRDPIFEKKLLKGYKYENHSINILAKYWNYATKNKCGRWLELEDCLFDYDRLIYLVEIAKTRVPEIERMVLLDVGDYPYFDEKDKKYLNMFINKIGFFEN